MELKEQLGKRIKELRVGQGLTQETLGERADLNYKFLGSIERGQENPTITVIGRIAEGLGIDPKHLLDCKHELLKRQDILAEIELLLKKADTEDLRSILKILRALLI
jgi:transcriptional regulator with XRE-family HTH domain